MRLYLSFELLDLVFCLFLVFLLEKEKMKDKMKMVVNISGFIHYFFLHLFFLEQKHQKGQNHLGNKIIYSLKRYVKTEIKSGGMIQTF